jgi:hypothetical protein
MNKEQVICGSLFEDDYIVRSLGVLYRNPKRH